MLNSTNYHPQFFTATILEWQKLLKPDKYKQIITDCLDYLVSKQRVTVYAFVIMDNHIHLIWQMKNQEQREKVQAGLLKTTAQSIKADLEKNHPKVLERFRVEAKDRKYQIWERNSLSIDLFTPKVFQQKLEYLHLNPVKAGLCKYPEEYYLSSASFYHTGKSDFKFLTHYNE